jgi:phosphotransferase system HPr (HPr) family protein
MDPPTIRRAVTVTNPQGLHARPADLFARTALKFACRIEVIKGSERVDGKSIIAILTLAAEQGTELTIEAVGADAAEAVEMLASLVARGFADGAGEGDIADPS